MNPIRCPKCGKINDGTTDFCIYCGTIFEDYKKEDNEIPNFIKINNNEILNFKKEDNNENLNFKKQENDANQYTGPSRHRLAIVLGYLFSILGGLIGLVIAIYLITRDDPNAKKHGKIQIAILAFWAIVLAIMLITGMMDYHMLLSTSVENMTSMNSTMNMSNLSSFL